MECAKAATGAKKGKKKHVKDDLDRIKQAEKKKRRLEKALATSAAIRSELEKKKLKKKEEQERLDEESAAMAEAVALRVLLDEDDSDDSSKVLLNKHEELMFWNHTNNINIFTRHYHDLPSFSNENVAGVSDAHQYERMWNLRGNSHFLAQPDDLGSSFYPQYFGEELCGRGITSLSIADDEQLDGLICNRI